jgi:hypothetical protein
MKKTFAVLSAALPLAVILTGCAQIAETVGNATENNSSSTNWIVDGQVETAGGSYSSIKVSDEIMNKMYEEVVPGKTYADIVNKETGEKLEGDPGSLHLQLREMVIPYFFDEFIDSTALEGGEPAFADWKAKNLADGTFASVPYTKEYLDGVHGEPRPVLTSEIINKAGGLKFIHDGKPRVTDANITFGEITWSSSQDGVYYNVATDWSVDYRITDATIVDMLKAMNTTNKATDDEVKEVLTDEAKDGTGENTLRVHGTAVWHIMASGENDKLPFYYVLAPTDFSMNPFIKPEFHPPAPATPAAP